MLPRLPLFTMRETVSWTHEGIWEVQKKILKICALPENVQMGNAQIQTLIQTGQKLLKSISWESEYDYHEESYLRKLLASRDLLRTQIDDIFLHQQDCCEWFEHLSQYLQNEVTKFTLLRRLEEEVFLEFVHLSIDEHQIPIRDFYHLFGNYQNETKALTGHKLNFWGVGLIQRVQFMDNFFDAQNSSELISILQEFQDVRMVSFYKSWLQALDSIGVTGLGNFMMKNEVNSLALLNIDFETILEDKYTSFWESCRSVRALCLSLNCLWCVPPDVLKNWWEYFPHLRLLHLGINPLDGLSAESLQAFFSFPQLKSLSLYDLNLWEYNVSSLHEIFSQLWELTHIDLGSNFDASCSTDKLMAIFPYLTNLKSLGFSANDLKSYPPEKLRLIFKPYQFRSLDLSSIGLPLMKHSQIVEIFHDSSNLQSLALERCEFHLMPIPLIKELFASFPALKKLNLNNNSLWDCSFEYFQALFWPLQNLEEICLIENEFLVFDEQIWDLILGSLSPNGRIIMQSHEREKPKILPQLISNYPHIKFDVEEVSLTDFRY